jgi:glutamine cyclotransferase
MKSRDSQSIYYFCGKRDRSIHRFDPVTKVTVKLSTVLPSDVIFAAGVTTLQSAFIFDAHGGKVLEFDLEAETVRIIRKLSFGDERVFTTVSVTDITSNRVWIFGTTRTGLTNEVKIFNTRSKLISNVNINISVL